MSWSNVGTACAAISIGWIIGNRAQQPAGGQSSIPTSIRAQEFILTGVDGKTCARLGLASDTDQPHLQLFNHLNGRSMIDLGVDFMGAATVIISDNGGEGRPGPEIVIENLGEPGVPTVRLLGQEGPTDRQRPEIEIRINSVGEPEITSTKRDGTSMSLIPKAK